METNTVSTRLVLTTAPESVGEPCVGNICALADKVVDIWGIDLRVLACHVESRECIVQWEDNENSQHVSSTPPLRLWVVSS